MEISPGAFDPPVPRARLIVCEKTSRWATALWRELAPAPWGARVHQTRTLPRCWKELAQSPASIVLLAADHRNAGQVVARIADLSGVFPHARSIVLADRDLADHQWLFREAGALHVAHSPRMLDPVVRLVRRHLAVAPATQAGLSQRILAQLPWGD